MVQREENLNLYIGEILDGMRTRWKIQAQETGTFHNSNRQPDILITEPGAAPLVIEHEVSPAHDVEQEARDRLGEQVLEGGSVIHACIALRSAAELRQLRGAGLKGSLRERDDFEYALYRGRRPHDAERWPANGWLRGSLADLALLAQQAMRPSEEIDRLAGILEQRIGNAETKFTAAYPEGSEDVAQMLAEHLKTVDDPKNRQSRRMAISILSNALIFQQMLVPPLKVLRPDIRDDLDTPYDLYFRNALRKGEVLQIWKTIRDKVDYHPIFDVAIKLLDWITDPRVARDIFEDLYPVVNEIIHKNVARSHDLTGHVFQRLITDRKFLATFYTHPASAALLATLALPQTQPVVGESWGDGESLQGSLIADFACGTGTLLSAAYERICALHELENGDAKQLHTAMLEQVLVGCDVLPLAVHLTLSMLASAYPEVPFQKCNMISAPYGKQKEPLDNVYALGSLELIEQEEISSTIATQQQHMFDEYELPVTTVGGHGEETVPITQPIPHGNYDLVIMNPPFTRPGGQEGQNVGVSVPAFAGLQNTRDEQRIMSKKLSELAKDICYDGRAGLGSAFIALAHKKLRQNGIMSFVLPITLIQGESWRKVRRLIAREYHDVTVVTISQPKPPHNSFSMDTGMGECLLIAHKGKPDNKDSNRATFVCLDDRPRSVIAGYLTGELIHQMKKKGFHKLEDTVTSGTVLSIGDDRIATIIDAPIDENPWRIESVRDMSTVQTAFHLAEGRVLLPRWPTGDTIPMTKVETLAEIGPYHQQIYRTDGEGAFEKIDTYSPDDYYPMLWSHDANAERCYIVEPDSHGQPINRERALELAKTASHVHHNRDFRFNSQSLSAAWTERETMGGRAWPTLKFYGEGRQEKVYMVWANSTWGILCYWWHATKQQSGRGMVPITAVAHMPTLDLRRLSPAQLAAAARIFADHRQLPMLPINQIDEDPNRAALDRRLLTEVLGLPGELCEGPDSPLALLRRKLAAEPSIHGGKKSKVVL